MDRIRLCPEPTIKEAKELTTAGRERIKPKNFVFPKDRSYPVQDAAHARNALARVSQHGSPAEKAKVRAKVHAKFPGIGEDAEKKGEAMSDDAVDKLAAALALGTTLAEYDLLGLRKQAVETAGRLLVGGGTKTGGEQAPPSPGLPPSMPSSLLPPRTPPAPPPPGPPPETQGINPKISSNKFASIMENTRQQMLRALIKIG